MADGYNKPYKRKNVKIDLTGYKKFLDDLVDLLGRYKVDVGIFNKKVAGYMYKQEFGEPPKLPPRSFLRSTASENHRDMVHIMAIGLKDAFFKRGAKSRPSFTKVQNALAAGGKALELKIVNKIYSNIPPPLTPYTVAHKKEKGYILPETALIATGKAVKSIKYRIMRKNPEGNWQNIKKGRKKKK